MEILTLEYRIEAMTMLRDQKRIAANDRARKGSERPGSHSNDPAKDQP